MTVIAMTREMGTLGKDVAMGLSVNKGLALVHHQLVEQSVAEKMEIGPGDVHRFLEGSESLLDRWKIDARRLSRYTAEEVLRIAEKGNVLIRGWGATALLKGVPNVLRVRICAPMSFRINVMMKRLGIEDREVARREIERNDAAHTRTIQRFFDTDWKSPLNYHVVLNTGALSVADCIAQIEALVASASFRETAESRRILADKIIETRVRNAFEADEALEASTRSVEITVSEGRVTLSGATSSADEIKGIVAAAGSVPGVRGVESRMAHFGNEYIWGIHQAVPKPGT